MYVCHNKRRRERHIHISSSNKELKLNHPYLMKCCWILYIFFLSFSSYIAFYQQSNTYKPSDRIKYVRFVFVLCRNLCMLMLCVIIINVRFFFFPFFIRILNRFHTFFSPSSSPFWLLPITYYILI